MPWGALSPPLPSLVVSPLTLSVGTSRPLVFPCDSSEPAVTLRHLPARAPQSIYTCLGLIYGPHSRIQTPKLNAPPVLEGDCSKGKELQTCSKLLSKYTRPNQNQSIAHYFLDSQLGRLQIITIDQHSLGTYVRALGDKHL